MTDNSSASAVLMTLGRCDEIRAEVRVRLAAGEAPAGPLRGTLVGPQRGRDTTLPVVSRLEPTSMTGVVRAILTEPAYWTPDLPNLYRLRASVGGEGPDRREIDTLVGLRRLGVRGRSLWLDGRRWVPRGCRTDGLDGLAACKTAGLAAVVIEPTTSLLTHADRIGVAVLAITATEGDPDPGDIAARIASWSSHPSVMLAILPATVPPSTLAAVAAAAATRKGTLLLASTVSAADPIPSAFPAGIDALVVTLDAGDSPHTSWRGSPPLPLVAWRREPANPSAGRSRCDALQAALAAWAAPDAGASTPWDWAGYLVG